jgi:hypothetical protein
MCKHRFHRQALAGAVALAALLMVACVSTGIGDILKSPGAYEGKDVAIAGKVISTHDLVFVKYYTVADGSGEIAVVTESALPKEGQSVNVKGRVNQAFAVGSARLVVIVESPPSR